MDDDRIGLGVIGRGGFGLSALRQVTRVPGVLPVGMAATAAREAGQHVVEDQAAWLGDRDHRRAVTELNGRESLAIAREADAFAHRGGGRR